MKSDSSATYGTLAIVAYLLFAVGPLVGNAVLVLLGAIANEFSIDPTVVLIAVPAFMFPFAVVQLFSGALSDLYGRVPVIATGLVVYAVGLLITGWAATLEIFILGNLLSGLGFGFVNPVLIALLTDGVFPEEIPRRMGIAGALAALSVGVGPFIAGLMIGLGWRSFYFLFLGIVIVGMASIYLSKRPSRNVREGSGLRQLFRNLSLELRRPVVLILLASAFMVSMSYIGTLIWTSRGLAGAIAEDTVGILLLGAGISGAVAGIVFGAVAKERGTGGLLGLAIVALLSAILILVFIGDITTQSALPLVGIALFVDGWAGGTLFPALIYYSQVLSPERRGALSGVVSFSNFFGISLVPMLYEPLFLQSITSVYYGILVVAVLLLLFLVPLYRLTPLHRNILSETIRRTQYEPT
ncbi:MAG: MFS transporter [Promethearchaeota archaeon]